MPRKLRLEFPGACYHVINRGNYRRDVFATEGAKAAFERCLFEACVRSHWSLHAFVIMRNHYHLAVETPEGNLVVGMQWLQATFANRFNRFRSERGHLFQGRYKALLVEPGDPLSMVSHYIHLNPLRAGIVTIGRLAEYRYSSYWYLARPPARPLCLRLDRMLAFTGGLPDQAAGWSRYADHLAWQSEHGPAGRSRSAVRLSQGWMVGSSSFKAALLKDHAVAALTRAWEKQGSAEIRVQACELLLESALRTLRRRDSDLAQGIGAQEWKVALALFLQERTQTSNAWLAHRLHLGGAKYASHLVSRLRHAANPSAPLAVLRTTHPVVSSIGNKAT